MYPDPGTADVVHAPLAAAVQTALEREVVHLYTHGTQTRVDDVVCDRVIRGGGWGWVVTG